MISIPILFGNKTTNNVLFLSAPRLFTIYSRSSLFIASVQTAILCHVPLNAFVDYSGIIWKLAWEYNKEVAISTFPLFSWDYQKVRPLNPLKGSGGSFVPFCWPLIYQLLYRSSITTTLTSPALVRSTKRITGLNPFKGPHFKLKEVYSKGGN